MPHYIAVKTNNRGKSDDWEDGDILYIKTPNECKAVWDQMRQNGRVTQEQYDASILPNGEHKWPVGTEEKIIHQGFVIDESISKSELSGFVEPEETVDSFNEFGTPIFKTIKRRKKKIVFEDIVNPKTSKKMYTNLEVTKIRSNSFTVTADYDNPISKTDIIDKPTE